ncbi:IclR family transcriptional regulator [Alicyclobacillus mengziensis]|uniref:IclR family transcriptional regulator n=1 Tax=Alicyclobacillus mengziensis TaxID=2931921 RepID=A0A9X7VYZ6_9BACL|nr:IclR family transcriptional regulator [Alicyclobacillus mengziensis]QSO47410.1 IclR family transcriptional regulator [Alicyclobacillus mengziensis]
MEELQTLSKAMDVLMWIANKGGEARASELEAEVGLSRSSLYRILGTLRNKNFVESSGGGVYRLGFGVLSLGLLAGDKDGVGEAVKLILGELTEQTGETSMLTAVSYPDAVCVARVESHRSVRLSFEVGRRMPMCAGASGKVLLMGMSDDGLKHYLADVAKAGILDRWRMTESDIFQQICDARGRGWLSTFSEVDEDAFAIGAPVYDTSGICRYGLSIAGPIGRFEEAPFVSYLQAAADRISGALFET